MRQSTRLIVNTLVTYFRMALTVGLGLAVTRIALGQLGAEDFGTLATLGASGILLLFLSDALTASTQRHLAFEIGRDDHAALATVFNTALVIFGALGLVAGAVGMALWPVLRSIIEVPPGRGDAAFWVYVLTLASLVVTVLATPYRGYLTAKQSFVCIALYDLGQAVFGLIAVLILTTMGGDKLVHYAWLLLGVRVAAESVAVAVSLVAFRDCWPRPWLFRMKEVPRIASFAGWSLFVLIAWRLRVQGSAILLNSFYGPGPSAAYGLATQVGGYQNQVGAAVWRAVSPAMTSIEAKGGDRAVQSLALVSSKYLTLLTLFFLIPVEYEMEQLLGLWLKGPLPPFTVSLTRLVLVWTALNWVSVGYQMAMEAKGNLGRYAIFLSAFDAGVLVVQIAALAFIPLGADSRPVVDPWLMQVIAIVILAAQNVGRAWYVGKVLHIPLSRWAREVLLPCAVVGVIAGGIALVPFLWMAASPWRLLATTAAFGLTATPAIWFLAMAAWEREHFVRVARGGVRLGLKLMGRKPPEPASATLDQGISG